MEFSAPKELTQIKEAGHRAPFLDLSPLRHVPSRFSPRKSRGKMSNGVFLLWFQLGVHRDGWGEPVHADAQALIVTFPT
jgi:hypothetical protein